jgi:phosphonate transport system substrate-binding protein
MTDQGRRSAIALLGLGATSLIGCGEAPRPDTARVQPLDALSASGVLPDKLWFGITPTAGDETATHLAPMTEFVSERLGIPVGGKTAVDYADVARMLNEGEIDMGIISPAAYVRARKGLKAVAIATATRRSSPTYLGYLVAKGTWPAPRLEEFRGKRMAWVNPSSTSGYLYPRELMRERGLDPGTFFGSTFFANDHPNAIKAVAEGEAELAAVGSPFVDPDANMEVPGARDVVVVAKTLRIPLDCVVIHKRIQRELAEKLQAALIALSSDTSTSRKLADSWGLSGFVRPMNQRYDEIARVLDKAKLEEG